MSVDYSEIFSGTFQMFADKIAAELYDDQPFMNLLRGGVSEERFATRFRNAFASRIADKLAEDPDIMEPFVDKIKKMDISKNVAKRLEDKLVEQYARRMFTEYEFEEDK